MIKVKIHKKAIFIFCFIWLFVCAVLFNRYAYEIDQFNAATRIFIRTGEFNVRTIDENGLPVSTDVRTGRKLISPFYVVHYGLMHSELANNESLKNEEHWKHDPSVALWNAPPTTLSMEQFLYNANWVVDNLRLLNDQYHLIYNFDWKYKNYPGGVLNAPWWSGLTDGYAILLMMRAYDIFKDEKYMEAAGKLYKSVVSPFKVGGSLIELNGQPWIEEYVDPKVDPKNMSRVLNGMIYAYKGIKAYELKSKDNQNMAQKLKDSINNSIEYFVINDKWIYYDLIGNSANIKYHRIHVQLLRDKDFNTENNRDVIASWEVGYKNQGLYWILSPGWSFAKYHFLLLFAIINIFPILLFVIRKIFNGGLRK